MERSLSLCPIAAFPLHLNATLTTAHPCCTPALHRITAHPRPTTCQWELHTVQHCSTSPHHACPTPLMNLCTPAALHNGAAHYFCSSPVCSFKRSLWLHLNVATLQCNIVAPHSHNSITSPSSLLLEVVVSHHQSSSERLCSYTSVLPRCSAKTLLHTITTVSPSYFTFVGVPCCCTTTSTPSSLSELRVILLLLELITELIT